MNKIPTAEELAYKIFFDGITNRKPNEDLSFRQMYAKQFSKPIPSKEYGFENGRIIEPHDTIKAMIEFAKLHVKSALEAAANNAKIKYDFYDEMAAYVDSQSILNAYPDENIK